MIIVMRGISFLVLTQFTMETIKVLYKVLQKNFKFIEGQKHRLVKENNKYLNINTEKNFSLKKLHNMSCTDFREN